MHSSLSFQRWIRINLILMVFLLLAVALFSMIGNPIVSPEIFWSKGDELFHDLFFHARLPRVILGVVVGCGLSSSGVAFQSLLRNPMADPYILGVSGGAALGGVLAMALGAPFELVSLTSFLFALGSIYFIYKLSLIQGRLTTPSLLLNGVMFNAFAFALILLIHSLMTPGQTQQIFYVLMGSLEAQRLGDVLWVFLLSLFGLVLLFFQSSSMNIGSLGEDSAGQLGLSVERHRRIVFFAASLIVGATVSISGLIGFVGLFIPHFARLLFGSDHRLLLPASGLLGGIYLVICDFLAKTLLSSNASFGTELPVGVVTALMGGPFFIFLLRKNIQRSLIR